MLLKILLAIFSAISLYVYFFEFPYRNIYVDICILLPVILVYYDFKKRNNIKLDPKVNELYRSINHGDFKKFKELIETKFENIKEVENSFYYGGVNVILYISEYENYEMLQYILDKGYDINSTTKDSGLTVINRSVYLNMKKMVEFLLEYNPDLEIASKDLRMTPLETAIFKAKPDLVNLLLKKGAKVSLKQIMNDEHKLIKWKNVSMEIKKALMSNLMYKELEPLFYAVEKNEKTEKNFEFLNAKKSTFKNSLVAIQ